MKRKHISFNVCLAVILSAGFALIGTLVPNLSPHVSASPALTCKSGDVTTVNPNDISDKSVCIHLGTKGGYTLRSFAPPSNSAQLKSSCPGAVVGGLGNVYAVVSGFGWSCITFDVRGLGDKWQTLNRTDYPNDGKSYIYNGVNPNAEKEECEDSGGTWANGGCRCPSGKTLDDSDSRCVDITVFGSTVPARDVCGEEIPGNDKKDTVELAINIGCRGKDNPIMDMVLAFTRFLSVGVGLAIIASLVVAGIQYTTSRGDPQATQKALKRASKTGAALGLYILGFALLNFLVPGGLFG